MATGVSVGDARIFGKIPLTNTFFYSDRKRWRSMALCPSGQGVGLELRWALPAQVRTLSVSLLLCEVWVHRKLKAARHALTAATAWPSGLRRQLKALVRKGVGSNPTAVIFEKLYCTCRSSDLFLLNAYNSVDTVSEWLRSWTRNPMGFARRGSNPLGVDEMFYLILCIIIVQVVSRGRPPM